MEKDNDDMTVLDVQAIDAKQSPQEKSPMRLARRNTLSQSMHALEGESKDDEVQISQNRGSLIPNIIG